VEGALAVLEAANCDIWVKPNGKTYPLSEDFLKNRTMEVLHLAELEELLDAATTEPYPYTKSWEEAEHEPFCLLHTSGSTGLPKPIVWSNGLIGTMDAVKLLPPTEGDGGMSPWSENWNDGDRIYSSFPMSHVCIYLPEAVRVACDLLTQSVGSWHHHGYPPACSFPTALHYGTRKCDTQYESR